MDALQREAARMSAGSLVEAVTVATKRLGSVGVKKLLALVDTFAIEVVPVEVSDASITAFAYARYGKGMKHPAQLNFGDCFAYALAKRTGEPLLCLGNDFARTDLTLVPLEAA